MKIFCNFSVFYLDETLPKASWIVGDGTNETDFTLTPEFISIVSKSVDITGCVTFEDLKTEGKTEINGANITTGSILADYIKGGTIKGTTIKGTTITGAEIEASTIKSGTITAETITGRNKICRSGCGAGTI